MVIAVLSGFCISFPLLTVLVETVCGVSFSSSSIPQLGKESTLRRLGRGRLLLLCVGKEIERRHSMSKYHVPTNRAKATLAKLQSAAVAVRLGDVPNISVATRDLSRPSLRVVILVLNVHRQSLDAQSRNLIVGDLEVNAT